MYLTTILVEDSDTIRSSLVPALEELANVRVVAMAATAGDAKKALEQWHSEWQLLVVDLFLASGSGLEVLRAVHDRAPGQQVLISSNYATDDMRRRCLELGADAVFDKSIELEAFFEHCRLLGAQR